MAEEWRPVPGYIGYEASDLGRVRSYRSVNGRGPLKDSPHLILGKPAPGKEYLRVHLSGGTGGLKTMPVHIVILITFKGPRPSNEHDGCHGDGDAKNNALTNLRWGTKQSNADDRVNHGTQVRGTAVNLAVLTEAQVREIKAAIPTWKKGLGRRFAHKFGVGDSSISAVKRGHTWSHI